MVLVFQNGGNRRVSEPSLQSQDLRSCGPVPFRRAPTEMDGRLPDRRGSLEPPDSKKRTFMKRHSSTSTSLQRCTVAAATGRLSAC
jgi:hypothetical protein